jgi:hypothetical protein
MSDNIATSPEPREEVSHGIEEASAGIKVLRNARVTTPAANSQTKLDFLATVVGSPSGTTGVTDLHALAETIMFDATRMVSILDSRDPHLEKRTIGGENAELVSIKNVMRGGAAVAGAFAAVCGLGTLLSGTVLLHPLIAVLLLASSIGFFTMSFLPRS